LSFSILAALANRRLVLHVVLMDSVRIWESFLSTAPRQLVIRNYIPDNSCKVTRISKAKSVYSICTIRKLQLAKLLRRFRQQNSLLNLIVYVVLFKQMRYPSKFFGDRCCRNTMYIPGGSRSPQMCNLLFRASISLLHFPMSDTAVAWHL
jgi:hypothetical protein